MTYEHYTDKSSELAGVYQEAGFLAEADYDSVVVYSDITVRDRVERIAEEFGAVYDGGGMYVGPLDGLSGEAS